MLIGAHVSISGGIDLSIGRGEAIGANCIQTFASPPRTLKFFPYSDEVLARYKVAKQASSIQLHVFHGVYLVNLANEKPEYVRLSVDSLVHYQQAASAIGGLGTIFHVGSHKGSGFEAVKHRVAQAIDAVLSESPKDVTLMLENAAGHKGTIGQTIDELAELFSLVTKTDQLGLCLDTQHAFASGVDGRNPEALDAFLTEVDQKIGLAAVKVIHTNDSKTLFDSHHDRHENIGEGELGAVGISNWLHHPKLQDLPFIMEVPGVDKNGPGEKDIQKLQSLV